MKAFFGVGKIKMATFSILSDFDPFSKTLISMDYENIFSTKLYSRCILVHVLCTYKSNRGLLNEDTCTTHWIMKGTG